MAEVAAQAEASKPLGDDAFAARKACFDEVFASQQASDLKLKARTWRKQAATEAETKEDDTLVYSEIEIDTLNIVLNKVKTDFGPLFDSKGFFLDLGAGAGKACVAAGLLHSFEKVMGIEKVPPLVEAYSNEAYNNVQVSEDFVKPPVKIEAGDFAADFDAKLADLAPSVTFALAVATFYGPAQLEAMVKLAEAMPACSIFVTFGQKLPAKLLIDLDRSPAQRYNVAAKKALSMRGVTPDGIAITADQPVNNPNGWFPVHSEEVQLAWGKSTYFVYKKVGAFFPFLQPEGAKFELSMEDEASRLCANLFVKLSMKEKASNLVECTYKNAEGTEDSFAQGVPAGWEDVEAMPKEGVFKGMYQCATEDCSFEFRKQLLTEYQYYSAGTGAWKAGAWEATPVSAGA